MKTQVQELKKLATNPVANSFDSTGLAIFPGILTSEQLSAINSELDELLRRPSLNGSVGSIDLNQTYEYKELMLPSLRIESLNLLELALGVRDLFFFVSGSAQMMQYKLTNLELFAEEKNPDPLFWHTDNRETMIRGMIFLQGGQLDSGAFQYMVGTHRRDYFVEHKLTDRQIAELKDSVHDCIAAEGSLVLFDSMGFHAKNPTLKPRRIIMFEFQPIGTTYKKSPIFLSSNHLTQKVVENLSFFTNNNQSCPAGSVKTHFGDPLPLPLDTAFFALCHSLKQWLRLKLLRFRSLLGRRGRLKVWKGYSVLQPMRRSMKS